MPAGDLIFQRLELATDRELAAIARALDEVKEFEQQPTRPERIELLSRELRADAGSVFGNLRRHDHELAYSRILEDVLEKASSAAGWSKPKYSLDTNPLRVEDYIIRAFTFALTREASTTEQLKKAEEDAARDLTATPSTSTGSSASGTAARVVATAAQTLLRTNPYVLTASAVAAVGFGIAWIAGPAMRRVTPAVLVLIQIRHRVEAEASLRGAA